MLAIVGGTGWYELNGLEITHQHPVETPFGPASAAVLQGRIHGQDVLFLARHGAGHRLLPHEVNYRANVFALKRAGATMLLGFSAVGSLRESVRPGDLAMPAQYIDWTRGQRDRSFFGQGVVAHVSTAKPVSAQLVDAVAMAAQAVGTSLHTGLTYACVEGPRLGTQAESHLLRNLGCDLVGMTNVPEVFLAREAQMAYATVGLVTDYDCWLEDPSQHVSATGIFELYGKTLAKAAAVLNRMLSTTLPEAEPEVRANLRSSLLSRMDQLRQEQQEWMEVLLR
jgi:5'-methylthioadenosine phosphorylase